MVRTTPRVEGDSLYLLSQDHTNSATIPLGSEQWYVWLESHQTFRMKGDAVTYTARKERRGGLWYWYAYRRSTGKLRIAYLGKSEELTAERLKSVAQIFALPPPHPARVRNSARASSATSKTSEQISLPENFSPARSQARGNLPAERTSFVGRTYQLEEAMRLLAYSRLLTLTGVGGIGKTRLALLSFTEQRLLCRLSIFTGGWTLEAAEAVCAGENIAQVDILDLLGKLVHKSLMQVHEEAVPVSTGEAGKMYRQARYRLLEMIREYGREKLQQAREEQILQRWHLAYFLQIAQQADTKLRGPQQLYWLVCLDNEHDNLQAALHVSQGTIRTHLSAIYSKLAVHSRTAAIHSAKLHGVL